MKRVSRPAFAITQRVSSSTTSLPSRPVSLRTVDSCGTHSPKAIRQNRRRCNESETSRTSVSYPQPVRCLTTIKRTYVSIGIDGRPRDTASSRQPDSIGASNPGSPNSTSNAARSDGSSLTSPGNTSSHNDSTCPPDSRSTDSLLDQKSTHLQGSFS